MIGSTFSESSSKVVALRLVGEEREDNAEVDVRFMVKGRWGLYWTRAYHFDDS